MNENKNTQEPVNILPVFQALARIPAIRKWKELEETIDTIEDFARKYKGFREPILSHTAETILRTNFDYCDYSAIRMRTWLEQDYLSIGAVLEILERWERFPIVSFHPNLGAGIYEHLVAYPKTRVHFAKWLSTPVLRHLYIEQAYLLPIEEELSLYEWALNKNEINAIKSSLKSFLSTKRALLNPKLQERRDRIIAQINTRK